MYIILHSADIGDQIKNIWSLDENGVIGYNIPLSSENTHIVYGNWSYFKWIPNKVDLTLPKTTLKVVLERSGLPCTSYTDLLKGLEHIYLTHFAKKNESEVDTK